MKVHDVEKYCEEMRTQQKEVFSKVDKNIQKAQDQYKMGYDKKHHKMKVITSNSYSYRGCSMEELSF